jgi:predicted neuraminidase
MNHNQVLDLKKLVMDGRVFRSPYDGHRLEAFIPRMGLENHASNMLELPNGDLLCAWFAGTMEGVGDINIALSRLPSDATKWTEPVWVSHDSTRSEQNPVLFLTPDEKVWLLYTAQLAGKATTDAWDQRAGGSAWQQWTAVIRRRVSVDYGMTWGPVETFAETPGSFCRNPVVVLSNGDWLFPMYYSLKAPGHGADHSVMRISEDQGMTWQEYAVPESRGRVHGSVVELEAGHLIAFFRSRAADWIYKSRSTDYGRTWTVPVRSTLPNNNASIQALKLASGAIALIFNKASVGDVDPQGTIWPRQRYPVTIAISEDGGETWPYQRHIDVSDGFAGDANEHLNRRCAYPSMIQTQDGALHVAYSYRDRQCIKYVRVSEAWVRHQVDYIYEIEEDR